MKNINCFYRKKQFSLISSNDLLDNLVLSSAKNSESIQKLVNVSTNSTESAFISDLQKEMKKIVTADDILEDKIDLSIIDDEISKMTAKNLESTEEKLPILLLNIWKNNSFLPS